MRDLNEKDLVCISGGVFVGIVLRKMISAVSTAITVETVANEAMDTMQDRIDLGLDPVPPEPKM